MRDYTFGNYICALREAQGYSQFQLGALVGVSDKAVSKWENGYAKPRMQTCIRLAEVLEVPLAELLQGHPCNPIISKERIMDQKKTLWNQAEANLRERYGADLPIAFAGRLATEKLETADSNFILHLDFLGKLNGIAEKSNSMISVRGTIHSSLTGWLMHATAVNPLPPHQYCPLCHRVILRPEVKDGWDLPAETCECGGKLRRDGHSIPFESVSRQIWSSGTSIEVDIPARMLEAGQRLVQDYYGGLFHVVPVAYLGIDYPMKLCKYLLLSRDTDLPHRDSDGILHLTPEEYHKKYGHDDSVLLVVSTNGPDDCNVKSMEDSLSPEKEDVVYERLVHQLGQVNEAQGISKEAAVRNRDIADELSGMPTCFSKLLKYFALCHSTGAWEDNGAELVKSGAVPIELLPACREDIWDMIQKHASLSDNTGNGIAQKFMEAAKLGTYARHGMPPEDEALLRRCGIPDWFVTYMKNIFYLFPKGHCIDRLLRMFVREL